MCKTKWLSVFYNMDHNSTLILKQTGKSVVMSHLTLYPLIVISDVWGRVLLIKSFENFLTNLWTSWICELSILRIVAYQFWHEICQSLELNRHCKFKGLGKSFVFLPADKAANNVVVVWRKYNVYIVKEEIVNSRLFQNTPISEINIIINKHGSQLKL